METNQNRKRHIAFNIAKCVSFLLIVTLVLSVFSPYFLPKGNDSKSGIKNYVSRGFYGEPKDSLDVIGIGNSNMESGFSPMELWETDGCTGYNCGEPGESIFDAYNMLTEVFSCQKPKVVLLDVDGVFPTGGLTDTFFKFLDSSIDRIFPMIGYHTQWKEMSARSLTTAAAFTWDSPTKGYRFTVKDKPFTGHRPGEITAAADRVSPVTTFELNEFESLCKKNGASLVLVYIPTAYSWNQIRHDAVERYAQEHKLPFLDLNADSDHLNFNWQTDTQDSGTHLNYSGAKKVTTYIGNYLQTHYILPDHRGENKYTRWNKDDKKYQKIKKPVIVRPGAQL